MSLIPSAPVVLTFWYVFFGWTYFKHQYTRSLNLYSSDFKVKKNYFKSNRTKNSVQADSLFSDLRNSIFDGDTRAPSDYNTLRLLSGRFLNGSGPWLRVCSGVRVVFNQTVPQIPRTSVVKTTGPTSACSNRTPTTWTCPCFLWVLVNFFVVCYIIRARIYICVSNIILRITTNVIV